MAQTTSRTDLGAFKNRDFYARNAAKKADPKPKRGAFWHVKARVDTRWRQLPPLILAIRQRACPKTAKRLSKFWQRMIRFEKPNYNLAQGSSCELFRLEKKQKTMFPAASTKPVLKVAFVVPRQREVKELEGTDNSGASLCLSKVSPDEFYEEGKELNDGLPPSWYSQVSDHKSPITREIEWQRVAWDAQPGMLRIFYFILFLPLALLIAIALHIFFL